MSTLLTPLTFFIYLLLGWHFCQIRLVEHTTARKIPEHLLLIAVYVLHGTAVLLPFIDQPQLHFGAAESLSLTAWLSLNIYLLGKLHWKLDGLEPPLFAFIVCFILLSIILPTGHAINYVQNNLSRSHFLLAMLAQGLVVNAAAVAILMRFSDKNLHQNSKKILAHTLPPLLTLEKLLFSCVAIGFALLTAALITGSILSEQTSGSFFSFSHKTIFALASWVIFGTLLIGRINYGWRGRFAANWALTGFCLLFLGYIGTRIALEAFINKG
ncbi:MULTISPECIES: cytochrome C assembly family protein [Deefgea]|uniref:cytochrome C assembly family protein n=1 Tax=Deefgea TaxID=400947 RepID=UPI00194403F8|nr:MULTISPECIES: cytochrome c biogenesis protein CcsA [Deefgea]MBM9889119.1 cytochrome c biogenesis protein CcsA [Deefgea sp. CFH1-16]